MGCAQSLIYSRRRSKNSDSEDENEDESEEDKEERERNKDEHLPGRLTHNRSLSNLTDMLSEEELKIQANEGISNSPLLVHHEVSRDQAAFFKMLDEKIEKGADYDENKDKNRVKDINRLRKLYNEWEIARFNYKRQSERREEIIMHPTLASLASCSAPSRRYRFSMPHLNGDVQRPYPIYTIRHHPHPQHNSNIQCNTNAVLQMQNTLNNSFVQYDLNNDTFHTQLL